ncbi:MAG: hypothetical protein LBQ12_07935, partial [Deltaproteobacteria bacterium]|nr:hypothetical protein [Deltaproteobacteria bacterium]
MLLEGMMRESPSVMFTWAEGFGLSGGGGRGLPPRLAAGLDDPGALLQGLLERRLPLPAGGGELGLNLVEGARDESELAGPDCYFLVDPGVELPVVPLLREEGVDLGSPLLN